MPRYKNNNSKKYIKSQYLLAGILFLLLLVFALLYFFVDSKLDEPEPVETTEIVTEQKPVQDSEEQVGVEIDQAQIQGIVDNWTLDAGGISSVVILDSNGASLGAHNLEQVYFAASIYKIFVAYAGYQQVDNEEVDPNEIYLNGYTRLECLDLMIRDSDSPCAEKLWNEYGKDKLTSELEEYGIENTSMSGVTTTAEDAAILLSLVANGEGLSETSRAAYLDSMKEQDELYRRGLPSGFNDLTVYNKVGWNLQQEWHDTAVVELSDGTQIIVSVFTEGVGFSRVSELGQKLEEYLVSL